MEKRVLGVLIISLIFSLIAFPSEISITHDEAIYLNIARNLVHGLSNFKYQDAYMMYRPPVYIYTLSIFFGFFNNVDIQLQISRVVSAIFYSFTSVLVYYIANILFNNSRKSILAALIFIINPIAFILSNRTLVHSQYTFFFTLTIFLFYLGRKNQKSIYTYLSFIFAGIAVLTRYTGFIILGILFTYLYMVDHWSWLKKKEYWVAAGLFLLTISPWLVLNHVFYGGAFEGFKASAEAATLDRPVTPIKFLTKPLKNALLGSILLFLGFAKQKKNEKGWLLTSWFFIGLFGILTIPYKTARFLTFITPPMSILIGEGIYFIKNDLWKTLEHINIINLSNKRIKTIFAGLLVIVIVISVIPGASAYGEYKESWDERNEGPVLVSRYVSSLDPDTILVSPDTFPIISFFSPNSKITQFKEPNIQIDQIKTKKYDIIIWEKETLAEKIKKPEDYKVLKTFDLGKTYKILKKES